MKRISWLLVVPLVLAALSAPVACVEFQTFVYEPGGGGGGTGGADGGSGGMMSTSTGGMGGSTSSTGGAGGGKAECMKKEDCIASECRTTMECTAAGVCVWGNKPEDTELVSQLYGDCLRRFCDGNGGIKEVPNEVPADTYTWTNPCYVNSCMAFPMPIAVSEMDAKQCTTPWGNDMGTCSQFECVECFDKTDCTDMKVCHQGRCVPMGCENGVPDTASGETDVDCGGPSCPPCGHDLACVLDTDCEKMTCDPMTMKCVGPWCGDNIQNGDETGVDCGGKCAKETPPKKCADSTACLFREDCESGVCKLGLCESASCNDHTQNQGEAGIDCGGPCGPCPTPAP